MGTILKTTHCTQGNDKSFFELHVEFDFDPAIVIAIKTGLRVSQGEPY